MKVSPSFAFAPANLNVRAVMEADADNRIIEIVAESPDFYRSSQNQLEGERAPRTNVFEFHGLPSGTYEVSATLIDASSRRLTVHGQINVIETGIGC